MSNLFLDEPGDRKFFFFSCPTLGAFDHLLVLTSLPLEISLNLPNSGGFGLVGEIDTTEID